MVAGPAVVSPRVALLLLLGAAVQAAPDAPIRDTELEKLVQEQEGLLIEVRRQRMKPDDLVARYSKLPDVDRVGRRQHAVARFLYGRALHRLKRADKAREQYLLALRTFERFPWVHLALGELARRAGDLGEAEARFKQAKKIDPQSWRAFLNLGELELGRKPPRWRKALGYFERARNLEPTRNACLGEVACHLHFCGEVFTEEKKAHHKGAALNAARLYQFLEPRDGRGYLLEARVHQETGDTREAAAVLERGYDQKEMAEVFRAAFLTELLDLYGGLGEEHEIGGVLRRMLELKRLGQAEREEVERRLRDLKEKGKEAIRGWILDKHRAILGNEGIALDRRQASLRILLDVLQSPDWFTNPKLEADYRKVKGTVFKSCFGAGGQPELLIPLFRFIRATRDRTAFRLLVWYVYPRTGENAPPKLRLEAVRAVAAVGGRGALPVLLHCRLDDDPMVLRAVDTALRDVTGRRSPVEEGIAPLAPKQVGTMRRFWLDYVHGANGARSLSRAFDRQDDESLYALSQQGSGRSSLPLALYVIHLVLDDDVPFEAWREAYLFLEHYLGRSYRAVERRGQPLERAEREAVRREVEEALEAEPAAGEPSGK
ncbi:MAG: tetratricopeptide repeat protein [Planctomycetota bacterium]